MNADFFYKKDVTNPYVSMSSTDVFQLILVWLPKTQWRRMGIYFLQIVFFNAVKQKIRENSKKWQSVSAIVLVADNLIYEHYPARVNSKKLPSV